MLIKGEVLMYIERENQDIRLVNMSGNVKFKTNSISEFIAFCKEMFISKQYSFSIANTLENIFITEANDSINKKIEGLNLYFDNLTNSDNEKFCRYLMYYTYIDNKYGKTLYNIEYRNDIISNRLKIIDIIFSNKFDTMKDLYKVISKDKINQMLFYKIASKVKKEREIEFNNNLKELKTKLFNYVISDKKDLTYYKLKELSTLFALKTTY